jgi:tetratricopeptide (TPR) repeat protein
MWSPLHPASAADAVSAVPTIPAVPAAELADEAMRLYLSDPRRARELAMRALAEARRHGDGGTASMAERCLGLIAQHLDDFDTAAEHLRAAVRLAERAGDHGRAAEARINLAVILAFQGRGASALRQLSRAEPHLSGIAQGWLAMERAIVLLKLGRWTAALTEFDRALPVFEQAGNLEAQARTHGNRGVLHLYRGELAAADGDLQRAVALFSDLGHDLSSAIGQHNLGYLAARRGDIPLALERYEEAERRYRDHGTTTFTLLVDRCELLLSVGLAAEARTAGEGAVVEAVRSRQSGELAEARLRLAQAAIADGDHAAALDAALLAAHAFRRQRRPAWGALARYAVLQARLGGDQPHEVTPVAARRLAQDLATAGWRDQARDAQMTAARLALDRGQVRPARQDLTEVSRARHAGPLWQRTQGWHAEAMLRLLDGRRAAARRAARRGLQLVEDYRATLGATDLRAGASRHVVELADLGLRCALEEPDPALVLRWAERSRAAHLLQRPVRPPHDEVLAADLAELRRIMLDQEEAVREGRQRTGLTGRQVAVERAICDRSRFVRGPATPTVVRPPSPADLAAALGGHALVEYLLVGGRLHALTLTERRVRRHVLGPAGPAEHELRMLPFMVRRLAVGRDARPAALEAARVGIEHAGRVLDAALLMPIEAEIGDRPLVVVPTGHLQRLPWSLLPSCRGRAVEVAPSATVWHLAATSPAVADDRVVLVAGPDLPHAAEEIDALAARYQRAERLAGPRATVEAVTRALDGSALAHLATHGIYRGDNPLFSSLKVHDGPLTVYDLERLDRAPQAVVLSACESGRSAVLAGDELLGLVAAFLALGTRTLVASVVEVLDAATAPLMLDLHAALAEGADMATALASAQLRAFGGGPSSVAAAASFVCFGASR